ncbi:MAG: chloride channel protein [Bacteroidales bacterium]|nr:chloride channel protein [Bacteroidales bacterium]
MKKQFQKVIERVILWQSRKGGQRQFVLLLSFVVGLLSGTAAVILKNTVYYTHYFITNGFHFERENYLYLAFPLTGILITVVFVKFIIKDNIGHGVSRILFAISKKNGRLKRHNTYSSMIASTITISFGGSVGLEAPIVLTGSSIGSNLGRLFGLNYKTIVIMIGCGAAGAIAGIFKAPIAALVFAIEVLMLDLTMTTLIPLLISAATGSMVAFFFMGKSVLFFTEYTDPFYLRHIPAFIALGLFTGITSLYFTRTTQRLESLMAKIRGTFTKAIAGGIILGIIIFVFPSLYGEGYEVLDAIMNGRQSDLINEGLFLPLKNQAWFLFAVILSIMLMKVAAMAITTGSGGIGGIFAPSLFVGGLSGLFAAKMINLLPFIQVSEINFILVGMAGIMSGVMHAPLTAIFLIAEITGGYELFTPLIITATISYLTIKYFEPHSIYAKRLALRGELITHHKDKAVLSMMSVKDLIETNFSTVHKDATLGDFVKVVTRSQRNVFPVIDDEMNFYGVVFINNIRDIIFDREIYDTTYIRDLMYMPSPLVDPDETMEDVAKKFSESENFNLPVIKNGRYLGFVSRAQVFSTYRKMLEDFSEE